MRQGMTHVEVLTPERFGELFGLGWLDETSHTTAGEECQVELLGTAVSRMESWAASGARDQLPEKLQGSSSLGTSLFVRRIDIVTVKCIGDDILLLFDEPDVGVAGWGTLGVRVTNLKSS